MSIYVLSIGSAVYIRLTGSTIVLYGSSPGEASDGSALGTFGFVMQLGATVWCVGAVIALVLTLVEVVRIFAFIKSCRIMVVDGRNVYISDKVSTSPFSFGNRIILGQRDYGRSLEMILAHETGHIRYKHSYDILFAQLVTILCWYNPAAWFLRNDLKTVHEYQADSYVLNTGYDAAAYQTLLIKKAAGSKFPTIGNNFNHSKLKMRISMMNRGYASSVRSLVGYPLLGVAFIGGIALLMSPTISFAVAPRVTVTNEDKGKAALDNVNIYIDGDKSDRLDEISPSEIKAITISKDKKRIDIETK